MKAKLITILIITNNNGKIYPDDQWGKMGLLCACAALSIEGNLAFITISRWVTMGKKNVNMEKIES